VKNNKREKKHPLADKVDKAFKGKKISETGKKKTTTGKKYPSDDKPGYSSRGKDKPASGNNRYAGAGKKYKTTEKTESGNFKSKPGTRTGSGLTKGRKSTDADNNFGKTDGNSKRTGFGDRKPAFGTKPLRTGSGKTTDDRKRPDSRKDKPERRDRETSKKSPEKGTEKRPFRKNTEDTKGKSFTKNKTPERYKRRTTTSSTVLKKKEPDELNDGSIRLNRYIANSGVCSRREADELISQGLVEVNGKVITEMGYKVAIGDVVKYDGGLLKREQFVYILLNKPKDFITTMDDPQERKTVMQLIAGACTERVYPVGRLDRNTTGLLILTNDGELTEKLTHPSNKISKVYQVELNRPLEREDLNTIADGGIMLEDGPVKVDDIAYAEGSKKILGIEIHEGRNRIVRRIFEHLGYSVEKLDRTMYAGLTKKDLPRGNWRMLTEKEIIRLKYQR
jgi:23S rRNA pseudouridine2605 synthase